MKYTKVAATTRVDFDLEDAPATLIPFDVNSTEFVPDFCVVTIALHDTDGPQVMKIELSGRRIRQNGKLGLAIADYVWKLSDEIGGLWPPPPPHVQELADAALDVVRHAQLAAARNELIDAVQLPPTVPIATPPTSEKH